MMYPRDIEIRLKNEGIMDRRPEEFKENETYKARLRDEFAIAAINLDHLVSGMTKPSLAEEYFDMADEMMKEREKRYGI